MTIYRGGDATFGSATIALQTALASTENGLGASMIGIEDADGNYLSTTVEGALAEFGSMSQQEAGAVVITGGTITDVTMTGTITISTANITTATATTATITTANITDMVLSGDATFAEIDSVLTAASVVDSCFIDTTKDTNPEWIKRTDSLSYASESVPSGKYLGRYANETAARAVSGATAGDWYQRTTTTDFYELVSPFGEAEIYRAGRAGFPKVALAVAESDRVVIYDLAASTGVEMWMVFGNGASYNWSASAVNISSIAYKEGKLVVAPGSLRVIDFANDGFRAGSDSGTTEPYGDISTRHGTVNWAGSNRYIIVDPNVNDVAITVLDTAPVNAFGLKEPTIAVATDGGISVITHDGSVYDQVYGTQTTEEVIWSEGLLYSQWNNGVVFGGYSITEDYSNSSYSSHQSNYSCIAYGPTSTTGCTPVTNTITGLNKKAIKTGSALSLYISNLDDGEKSLVADISISHNTGWMLGDIRRALLANSKTADRSVKASTLTENGTVTEAVVATGSELKGYSGFSASNYLSQAYSADLDFGTSDFSVSWWFKSSTPSATDMWWDRSYYSGDWSGSAIRGYMDSSGLVHLRVTDDAFVTSDYASSTDAFDDDQWHKADAFRSSDGKIRLYIDGKWQATTTLVNAVGSLSNTIATLHVGFAASGFNPAASSNLALLRFSGSAPSGAQVEFAYETERHMFQENSDVLLGGASDAITALDYDDVADLLHVGTSSGRYVFNNLVRVGSEATAVGAIQALSAHGKMVSNGGANGSDLYIPELDLREQALTELVSDEDNHDGEWKSVTNYINSWADHSTAHAVRFRKTADGYVELEGLIAGGAVDTTAFTLPVGYRPGRDSIFPNIESSGGAIVATRVYIDIDGTVNASANTGSSWSALTGIRFLAGN